MKTVFNFTRLLLGGLVLVGTLLASPPAYAESVFWTPRDLLASFFPKSERVGFRKLDIAPADRARIERRLGAALPVNRSHYTVFVAESGGRVDGYALFDDEVGEHLPISFAVKISPSGIVERQEIVAYREPRGDEVRDGRFRAQFVGKTSRDTLRAGDDIVAVSGATISSRAMAVGVKRVLVVLDELVLRPAQSAGATAQR